MASHSVKHLTWNDGTLQDDLECLSEYAKRDGNGNVISSTYVKTVNNTAPVNGNVTLTIPMQNNVESLNASVSASILMYNLAK